MVKVLMAKLELDQFVELMLKKLNVALKTVNTVVKKLKLDDSDSL